MTLKILTTFQQQKMTKGKLFLQQCRKRNEKGALQYQQIFARVFLSDLTYVHHQVHLYCCIVETVNYIGEFVVSVTLLSSLSLLHSVHSYIMLYIQHIPLCIFFSWHSLAQPSSVLKWRVSASGTAVAISSKRRAFTNLLASISLATTSFLFQCVEQKAPTYLRVYDLVPSLREQ